VNIVYFQKKCQAVSFLAHEKIFWSKVVFYAHYAIGKNRKLKKIKIEDFFGRKPYFTPLWQFFMLIKKKPHVHIDNIRKKNCRPKIENFHCYVHIFAVSKVDLPPPFCTRL
jgi:hypothetical protein